MKSRGSLEEFGNMSSRIRCTTCTKNTVCVCLHVKYCFTQLSAGCSLL